MNRFLLICLAVLLSPSAHAFEANKNSEAALAGYQQCMSNKRQAHAKRELEYTLCMSKTNVTEFTYCQPAGPFFDGAESETCKSEFGINSD